jgi:hypothetical protein
MQQVLINGPLNVLTKKVDRAEEIVILEAMLKEQLDKVVCDPPGKWVQAC